ncbi:peptidase M35 [Caballeronia catudaia]|uniref:Peptidase M35 n=1 Tax=Caballeronia catudaia TaxID=1777136 RepID=A0A158CQ74_9BURK|nr:M35 family metallo-endopeptidase [Caballeronia catudaia]SAK84468.1 peptidase M35 [Caballeronia catudaia]
MTKELFLVRTSMTNTEEGSSVIIDVNTQRICPNMSNAAFRELVMRLRDTAITMIDTRYLALARYWDKERAPVEMWFGKSDESLKQMLLTGLPKLKAAMLELKAEKIVRYDDELSTYLTCVPAVSGPGVTAAVCKPDSSKRIIAIYPEFCGLPETHRQKNSQLKTLIHECTHFVDTFDSLDTVYGSGDGLAIWAKMNSDRTEKNADSITCYIAN